MINFSIKRFFLVSFFLGLATIIIILSLFAYHRINNIQKYTFQDDTREATRRINGMISSLYKINLLVSDETPVTEENKNELINEYSDNLKDLNEYAQILGYPLEKEELSEFPEELFLDMENYRSYVDVIAAHSRNINDLLRVKLVEFERITDSIINIIIVLGLVIFTVILVLFVIFRKYLFNIESAVNHVKLLVEGKDSTFELKPNCREEKMIFDKLKEVEEKLNFQNTLLKSTDFGTLEDILPDMFPLLKKQIPCERLGVAFMESSGNVVAETVVSDSNTIHLGAGFSERIEKTTLGKIDFEGDPRIINDLEYHFENVHKSSSTLLILKEGYKSSITVPINIKNSLLGFVFISSTQKNVFNQNDAKTAKQFVQTLKSEIYNSYLLQEIVAKTAKAFADLVEKKDFETGNHLLRVARYSELLARELSRTNSEITPKMIREIFWFAPLHDIGKVGIPDNILLKPGKLDAEEFKFMKTHVLIGEQVMENMNNVLKERINLDLLKTGIQIIACHHEKWDGTGYPRGLKGEEIPITGRIVAIADVFDALMSARSYKKAFSFEKSIEIIEDSIGTHFCPVIGKLFLENKEEMLKIRKLYDD